MKDYLIVGTWILAIYLSFTSFKRAELYRSKDKIIDRLDKLQEWVVKEIKSIKNDEDRKLSMPLIESYLASKITQIELRLSQFNTYSKSEVFDVDKIAKIRSIDFFSGESVEVILKKTNNEFSDLIEYIELRFENHSSNKLSDHLSSYWREFLVFTTTLGAIYYALRILGYFFG